MERLDRGTRHQRFDHEHVPTLARDLEAGLVTLLALTSKSLIRRRASGRYDLHDVVRQYALFYLAQMPDCDATCERVEGLWARDAAALPEAQLTAAQQWATAQTLETVAQVV